MVIVIGATGFIGMYTVDRFLEEGYEVLATGRNAIMKQELEAKGVTCVSLDISKKEDFDKLPTEGVEGVIFLAGLLPANVPVDISADENAADYIRINVEGTINVLEYCRKNGIKKVVMMTGDSERTASAIAARVGVDEYYSEVLPEDKASFVEKAKAEGHKVIMIGDGINDSPALSAADIGIAISDGAEIAREIADITVGADNLKELVTLKVLSNALMKRIHKNYRTIVGFNTGLIVLGVAGVLQPTVSALLHNTSTLVITLKSMQNLLD